MKIHINQKGEWTLSNLEWEKFDALRAALRRPVAKPTSRSMRRVRRELLRALDDANTKVWAR